MSIGAIQASMTTLQFARVRSAELGVRETFADVGATVADDPTTADCNESPDFQSLMTSQETTLPKREKMISRSSL